MRAGTQSFGSAAGGPTSYADVPSFSGNAQPGFGSAVLSDNALQHNQINEFGADPRGASSATPSRPAAPAIAAGLTRPTNAK